MSSGLRFRAALDPDFNPAGGYPDHLYVYTGTVNSFELAATRPQQWPPNTVGRYSRMSMETARQGVLSVVSRKPRRYRKGGGRSVFGSLEGRTHLNVV